jgi:hypothetical protein
MPNFKSKPANNILATVGASTCIFGNQKCKKNKGNFTKKIKIILKKYKLEK